MSIINDTLKQLERSGRQGAIPNSYRADRVPQPQAKKFDKRWLLLALLPLLGWLWWPTLASLLNNQSATSTASMETTVVAPEQPQTVKPASVAVSEPEPLPIAETMAEVAAVDAIEPEPKPKPVAPAHEVKPEPVVRVEAKPEAKAKAKPEVKSEAKPATKPAIKAVAEVANAVTEPAPTVSAPESKPKPVQPKPQTVAVKAEPKPEPKQAPKLAPTPVVETKAAPAAMQVKPSPLSPQEMAEKLWQQAQAQQNPIPVLQQALQLNPQLHKARMKLLALLDQAEAEAMLLQAVEQFPEYAGYAVHSAERALAMGDSQLAKQWLNYSQRLIIDAEQQLDRALLAQQLNEHLLAVADWRQLVQQQPSNPNWWISLAYNLEFTGDLEQARRAYRQALALPGLDSSAIEYGRQRLQQLGDGK